MSTPVYIDPAYYARLIQIESGGKPNAVNPITGAKGLWQALPTTAAQYGTGDEGLHNFSEANARTLAFNLGRSPTPGELYLAHQQGAGGASSLLGNPDALAIDALTVAYRGNRKIAAQALLNNGGSLDMKASAFARKWTSQFGDINSGFAPDRAAPSSLSGIGMTSPNAVPPSGPVNSADWMNQASAGQMGAQGSPGPSGLAGATAVDPNMEILNQVDQAGSGQDAAPPSTGDPNLDILHQVAKGSFHVPGSAAALSGYQSQLPASPQMEGFWRIPAMVGSDFAKGVTNTLGLPADLMHAADVWGMKNIIDPLNQVIGLGSSTGTQVPAPLLGSESLSAPLQKAGIIDRPDLQAQTPGEQRIASMAQGAGSAAPFAVFGGPLAAARTLLSGAGSGLGAYEGGKRYGQTGQIIGSVLGGFGTDALAGLTGKAAGAAAGTTSPLLAAYDRLAMKPRSVGQAIASPALQYAEKTFAKMPGGVGVSEHAAQKTLNEFHGAVENSANKFGPQRTPEDAGEVLQQSSRNWIQNKLPAINQTIWAPVDAAIGAGTPTSLANYRGALESIATAHPGMTATSAALTPKAAKTLLDALNKDVPAGSTAAWSTVQGIRTHLGDMMGTPEFVDQIGQKNLSKIYGALTQDMRETARAAGVLPYFDQANRISTEAYAFRDNTLSKFVKAKNPILETITPDKAAAAALRDNTTLQKVRQQLPDAADALAAYELWSLGLKAGTAGATATSHSPAGFLTDLNKLRLTRAQGTNALYGPRNQDLADLAHVSQAAKAAEKFANTSGTAGHALMGHTINALGVAAGAAAGGGMTHELLPALGGAVALPLAGNVAARALNSHWLARLAATPSLVTRNAKRGVLQPLPAYLSTGLANPGQTGGPR